MVAWTASPRSSGGQRYVSGRRWRSEGKLLRMSSWTVEVEVGGDEALPVGGLREDHAPGVDDHRSPVAAVVRRRISNLAAATMKTWSSIALARISTSQWSRPVRSVKAEGTVITRAPAQGEDPVELGEAEVVTDGQPDLHPVASPSAISLTGLLDGRLPVGDVADVDVEQVDLAVDGARSPSGPNMTEVFASLSWSGTTSGTLPATRKIPSSRAQRHAAVSAGPSSGSAEERSRIGRAKDRPLLREDDELGAVGRGGAHEAPGNLQVAVILVRGVELYGGGAHLPGRCPVLRVHPGRLTDQSI